MMLERNTKPYFKNDRCQIYCGDCREVIPRLDMKFDAVLTDPPYGLKFMGKSWDHGVPGKEFWEIIKDACKPGAMLLAFGGTRTHHRLMCAIEDAGWEIRDCLMWIYGSGFPKSRNISKAIDKTIGKQSQGFSNAGDDGRKAELKQNLKYRSDYGYEYKPTKDLAKLWDGWGTALKPAWEPIILAMKPIDGTFANNALKNGVAGLNIDGCKVGYASDGDKASATPQGDCTARAGRLAGKVQGGGKRGNFARPEQKGRWPANLIHDGSEEVVGLFPVTGPSPKSYTRKVAGYGWGGAIGEPAGKESLNFGDSGSAARFFYCAKASRRERNQGCEGMLEIEIGHNRFDKCENCGGYLLQNPERPSACKCKNPKRKHNKISGNHHPTVKPVALCEYLARLILPPEQEIPRRLLVPFAGSGSEMIGGIRSGWTHITGVELEEEYCQIAEKRVVHELSGG